MQAHDIRTVMETPAHFRCEERDGGFWMPEKFNDGTLWICVTPGSTDHSEAEDPRRAE